MITALAQALKVEALIPLSRVEATRLEHCEQVIERGLNTFYEVGNALAEIRDSRLYRIGFPAFEDYCLEKWGISKRRGYELIAAAAVVDNVRNSAQTVPANEAQANELTGLEPEAQSEVWQRVVKTADKSADDRPVVTAAHVKAIVREYLREHGEEFPDEPQRTPRQELDRSELEALYDPDIQSRLTQYIEMISKFENMEWPEELAYLLRMFKLHKAQMNFQKTRNVHDDCDAALNVLKRLTPDPALGLEIAAQEHYDWLFDLGYCMSKKQYTERMKFMSQDDQRMALWTNAGEEARQEGRRGALPGIVVLPWKKVWKNSRRFCEQCHEVMEEDARGKACNDCRAQGL